MKKVRYALAAAGLVPITGALCIPQAMATTTAASPARAAKTVSTRLHGLAALRTPASSPDNTYCTGSQWIRAPKAGSSYIGFYYTEAATDTCIGTIKGELSNFNINYSQWRIRLWYYSGHSSHYKQWIISPTDKFSVAVHRAYPGLPHVCVAGESLQGWRTFYCAYTPG
jgi:hypothetical protein